MTLTILSLPQLAIPELNKRIIYDVRVCALMGKNNNVLVFQVRVMSLVGCCET